MAHGENQNECPDATRSPLEDEEWNLAVHARDCPKQVVELSLTELCPFKDHPFHVVDDVHMESTAQSIKDNGALVDWTQVYLFLEQWPQSYRMV